MPASPRLTSLRATSSGCPPGNSYRPPVGCNCRGRRCLPGLMPRCLRNCSRSRVANRPPKRRCELAIFGIISSAHSFVTRVDQARGARGTDSVLGAQSSTGAGGGERGGRLVVGDVGLRVSRSRDRAARHMGDRLWQNEQRRFFAALACRRGGDVAGVWGMRRICCRACAGIAARARAGPANADCRVVPDMPNARAGEAYRAACQLAVTASAAPANNREITLTRLLLA
jgi:hypothetical protein